MTPWTLADRNDDLARAARSGVELLVIGGGITGAGVLRDAAQRGLSALLVEAEDFAGGTSSATSKMIHGGLRYLAEGQLTVTRQSCVERDRLRKLNPNLVRELPFLFCSFADGVPPWKVRLGLTLYGMLAGFGKGRHRMIGVDDLDQLSRDLRREGLRAAGLYYDAQVDDARFVLEVIKAARRSGAQAVSHAALVGFDHDPQGRLIAARIEDRIDHRSYTIPAQLFVNATGPGVDHVRSLDRPQTVAELRPAKGVHLCLRRDRLHADAAIACQAADGRNMFLCPYHDVHLVGTTDTFVVGDDWRSVKWHEVDYLLEAVNRSFPTARLTRDDVISVYAGARPLVADPAADTPPSSVSREHRITADPSGLISVAGGKLTTFRAMAEELVDRAIGQLSRSRRQPLRPCQTARQPLRDDDFDRAELDAELAGRYDLGAPQRARLIEAWGAQADPLLRETPASWRLPIAGSRYLLAEVAWGLQYECATSLCDLLEHRLRIASLCPGQGLAELPRLAAVAAEVAGWSAEQQQQECEAYCRRVRTRYQVSP